VIAWFEKHLNAAVVLHTVFAWLFSIILVEFALHISGNSEISGGSWFPGWYVTYNVIIDIATIISLPVYYLVLKKKKRSLWYLVWFILSLLPLLGGFIIVFIMPLWIIGFITLLELKTETKTKVIN
jgi:hypothetical protein